MMPLPGWLLKEERYRPGRDRDAFLDRSIRAFLGVLARSRNPGAPPRTRTDPLVKTVAAFLLLILVSLTGSAAFLALAGTGLLVLLALQQARLIATVLRTSLAVAAGTALLLAPSVCWGLGRGSALIVLKVLLSAITVQLLAGTTAPAALAETAKRLGVPDLCILICALALEYICLLGGFALALLEALKLRSVGRNAGKADSISAIAGTLFLKSKEMAEAMYDAMVCRGFTGEYRTARLRLGSRDFVLGGAMGLLALAYLRSRL